MSTRRARIKAVTSLPPRRKNNDGANNTKAKLNEKETIEKPTPSPRTPRGIIKNKDRNSPKPASPLNSPRSANVILKNQKEKAPSPVVVATKDVGSPMRSEKVSVITSTYSVKSNVFVSPKSVGSPLRKPTSASPLRKPTLSPLVNSSRVDVNIQRLTQVTPEKSQQKDTENKVSDIVKNDEKPKDTEEQGLVRTNVTSDSKSGIPDDYNVPSVPESITEDTVMDGIVPLQAESSAPKPIALLKNEIISENAEVLFDPIVPLPSPSKVRPKLRPVPRLGPLRRNSIQGSASESEDENRRALLSGAGTPAPPRQRHDSQASHSTMHSLPHRDVSRIRNDSICSSVSQATTQPAVASSPVKEKSMIKTRRVEMSRRMAAMRRRRETVKPEALTMYDLIFYNPSSNPIVPDEDELKAQQANEKEEAVRKAAKDSGEQAEAPPPESDAAPVPQIKLGPNGEIMLDEQSLVIKQSDKRTVSGVVHEGAWGGFGGGAGRGRYRRTPRTADWCDAETVRFYRALAALGTDFMLMERLFPGRTRRDLKLKFKKEERVNMAQVDKALRTSSKWDAMRLLEEFEAEREQARRRVQDDADDLRRRTREHRERMRTARDMRLKMSRGSKALEYSVFPEANAKTNMGGLTADDLIQQHYEAKKKSGRAKRTKTKTPKLTSPPLLQPAPETNRQFVTPTRIPNTPIPQDKRTDNPDTATILKLDPTKSQGETPQILLPTPTPTVPANIESGSLVVLTVNDPNSPSKKMLQTYVASGGGKLTPVALPTSFLNSVVTYMKKGTPKSNKSAGSSPHLTSPSSVTSQDSRACSTPGIIQMNTSPAKRQRHSSYTITHL